MHCAGSASTGSLDNEALNGPFHRRIDIKAINQYIRTVRVNAAAADTRPGISSEDRRFPGRTGNLGVMKYRWMRRNTRRTVGWPGTEVLVLLLELGQIPQQAWHAQPHIVAPAAPLPGSQVASWV